MRAEPRSRVAALVLVLVVVAGCGAETPPPSDEVSGSVKGRGPGPGSATGFNLLVITLDTVRADHVGVFGERSNRTPNLDTLSQRGVSYHQAVTVAPITLPAHASLFTGVNPPTHGVRVNGFHRLAAEHHTLAEILGRAGYDTSAVVGSAVLDASMGLDQGFSSYDDAISADRGRLVERRASVVTDLGIAQLDTWVGSDRPGMLWLHYFDAHDPYDPPEPFATMFLDSPYAGEIAFVDEQLGRLMGALEQRSLAPRTLVVVVADHGEGLGEHGEITHTHLIYDSTMRIPLIMVPGTTLEAPLEVRDTVVSLVDVFPTVLSWLGVDPLDEAGAALVLDGVDLSPVSEGSDDCRQRVVYMETLWPQLMHGWAPIHGLRSRADKYISAPVPEYYRLDDDPGELDDLLPRADERTRDRVEILSLELGRHPGVLAPAAQVGAMDPAVVDQLLALGYVVDVEAAIQRPETVEPEALSTMIGRWQQRWQELLKSHEAQDANTREVLLRSVALGPNEPDVHLTLGEYQMTHGELAAAEGSFLRVTELDSARVEGWLRLAEVRGANKDWQGVGEAVARAKSIAPEDYRVTMLEGRLALFTGDPEGALVSLRAARRTAPPAIQRQIDGLIRGVEQRMKTDQPPMRSQ